MGRYREVPTEKEERSLEARIWWALWGVALVVLLYTAWHQIREYDLIHNGQSFEAEYEVYKGMELARYYDENNHYHSYNIGGLDAVHGENTITMYYKHDIARAQPRVNPRLWIFSYVFFGAGFVGCSLRLRKIYSQELHKIYE